MEQDLKDRIEKAIQSKLEDEKENVRFTAIKAMSLLSGTVETSVEELIKCLIDGDDRQRSQSRDALMQVGVEAVLPLVELLENGGLQDPDWEDGDPEEDRYLADQDGRLSAIAILTEIYMREEQKDKESGTSSKTDGKKVRNPQDQKLADLIKDALKEGLTEVFEKLVPSAETPDSN